MKITEATYSPPSDDDGSSAYTSIKCTIENNSESTIEMSKGYALLLDENGLVIGKRRGFFC